MTFALITRFAPGLAQWLTRAALQAVRESKNRWDDRRARELYDLAGAYRTFYEDINPDGLSLQSASTPPARSEPKPEPSLEDSQPDSFNGTGTPPS